MSTSNTPEITAVAWQPTQITRIGEIVRATASVANIAQATPVTFTIREYSGGQYQERDLDVLTTVTGPGASEVSVTWPVRLVAEPGETAGLPEYRFRAQLGQGSARTSKLLKLGRVTNVGWLTPTGNVPAETSGNCQVSFQPGQRLGLVATANNLNGFRATFTILQRQRLANGQYEYRPITQIKEVGFVASGSAGEVQAKTEWGFDPVVQPELVGGQFRFTVHLTHPSAPGVTFNLPERVGRSKLACNQAPAPQILEIFPNEGGLDEEVVVRIQGTHFQPGARVRFGAVKESPEVTYVDDRTLLAKAPVRATAKTVDVTVINQDEQKATLVEAFTYLDVQQKAQARLLRIEPSTVIEGVATPMILYGRHLKEALDEGLIALRAPQRAFIARKDNLLVQHDEASKLDFVFFTLTMSPASQAGGPGNPLNSNERMPVQVLVSRRPHAAEDLLVEDSAYFTVLPGKGPVPLAYSGSLTQAGSSMSLVVGRNLDQCRLRLLSPSGEMIELDDEQSQETLLVVTTSAPSELLAEAQLSLLDGNGLEVGRYQMVQAGNETAFSSGTAMLVTGNGAAAPTIDLQPIPGQRLVSAPANSMVVFDLKNRTYLDIRAPDFDSPHFNSTASFEVLDLAIPLFGGEFILSFFDRGSSALVDAAINARVGRLFALRGSALLLVIRVSLLISVNVAIIITVKEVFSDIEYPDEVSLVIQVDFVVDIDLILDFRLLLAAMRPRLFDPVSGSVGTELVVLLDLGFNPRIGSDGVSVDLELGSFIQASLLGPIRPFLSAEQQEARLILIASIDPCADDFGFRTYFFAARPRRFSLSWNFPVLLEKFLPFPSRENPTRDTLQTEFIAEVTININNNDQLRTIRIQSDPPAIEGTLALDSATTANLRAFAQPVDKDRQPLPGQSEMELIPTDQVQFKLIDLVDPVVNVPPDGQVVQPVVASGEGTIVALVPTSGTGTGVHPDTVMGFAAAPVPLQTSMDCLPPLIISTALPVTVGGEVIVVEVSSPPVVRSEPFAPPLAQQPLTLQVKSKPANAPATVEMLIDFEVIEFEEPLVDLFLEPLPIKTEIQDCGQKLQVRPCGPGTIAPDPRIGRIDLAAVGKPTEKPALRAARFFKGDLNAKGVQFQLDLNKTEAQVVDKITLTANHREKLENGVIVDLVPPAQSVVQPGMKVRVRLRSKDGKVRFQPKEITLPVVVENSERFEEYYRVLHDTQPLVANPPYAAYGVLFAAAIASKTNASDLHNFLAVQGDALWAAARTLVQAGSGDDRGLYFARLQAIVTIRQHTEKVGLNPADAIAVFERHSRGLDALNFAESANQDQLRVLITGFDPFGLSDIPSRGNGSGITALAFSDTTQMVNGRSVMFQSAILPVRFADFDRGLIETLATIHLDRVHLFVTTSQGRDCYYDLERLAAKNRRASKDNNNEFGVPLDPQTGDPISPASPPNLAGPEFLETTLPLTTVVLTANETRPGPDGNDFLVINQSFRAVAGPDEDCLPSSATGTVFAHKLVSKINLPQPGAISIYGSGGSFLSNEIFYRVANVRSQNRPTLRSGHLHLPSFAETNIQTKRQGLIDGVTRIVQDFLAKPASMMANPLTFEANATTGMILTFTNTQTKTITVDRIATTPHFALKMAGTGGSAVQELPKLGLKLKSGESVNLEVFYQPKIAGPIAGELVATSPAGLKLFWCDLFGRGIA